MNKHFLFILTRPPFGSSSAQESTDAIMATAAFGQRVSILALGDSLLQFLDGQVANAQAEPRSMKNTAAMLSSLPLYDVEQIYTPQDNWQQFEQGADFVVPVVPLSSAQITELVHDSDLVLNY